MFDQMVIKSELFYDQNIDVGGREDYGYFGNFKDPATQPLTFMIEIIRGKLK